MEKICKLPSFLSDSIVYTVKEQSFTYGASFSMGEVHPLAFTLTGMTPSVVVDGVVKLLWVILRGVKTRSSSIELKLLFVILSKA